MAKSSTTWQKGHSGNPSGGKPKGRALTEILQRAGAATLQVDGKNVTGKRLVAQLLWEVATTGKANFPDGSALEIAPQDWLAIVKFLYQHIDGPPKAELGIDVRIKDVSQLSDDELDAIVQSKT